MAVWGNLVALAVTIGLLGATLRLGRPNVKTPPPSATAVARAKRGGLAEAP